MKKLNIIPMILSFIFLFLLQYSFAAESCNSLGLIQYKPKDTCLTESRSCCGDETWSEWGKACSCACEDGKIKESGNNLQICQSCKWVDYGCSYYGGRYRIGDKVPAATGCTSRTCEAGGGLGSEVFYDFCECQPYDTESEWDNWNTYYGCSCYKGRSCTSQGVWGPWEITSAQVPCKMTKHIVSKQDCGRQFGYSDYDLDRYCGYFGGQHTCYSASIEEYFQQGSTDLRLSCVMENSGMVPYWWDTNSQICYAYKVFRMQTWDTCERECQAFVNSR